MPHLLFILYLFVLGACVGSFLNVVVWRLPMGMSLVSPRSHCPNCKHPLAIKDNIPVLGWILLRGKCRYCQTPISPRYPVIEAITGLLFVLYYVLFFIVGIGPCLTTRVNDFPPTVMHRFMTSLHDDWAIYGLLMFMVASLLAISLIDAAFFIIPIEIPWIMAGLGIFVHALVDNPSTVPGSLNLSPGLGSIIAAGGGIGLLLSIALYQLGIFRESFPEGEPALEVDEDLFQQEVAQAKKEGREPPARPKIYTKREIRIEMLREFLFLLPPIAGAILFLVLIITLPSLKAHWEAALQYHWLSGALGAIYGALIGAILVWAARILGTLALGRVAMGLGDVHLMLGVGAIIGAGPVTVAFFAAPFAALVLGLWMLLTRQRHELPYGPYLSLASAATILFYYRIADYFAPGFENLAAAVHNLLGL